MADEKLEEKEPAAIFSPSAISACLGYNAVVTELYENRKPQRLTPSVHEMIYNLENVQENLDSLVDTDDKTKCRWYHIPVNNMIWVNDLFKQLGHAPPEWDYQFRAGPFAHSRCMIPQCNSKLVEPLKSKSKARAEPGTGLITFYMPYLNYESIKTWKEHQDRVQKTKWFDPPIQSHLTSDPDASKSECSESPTGSSLHSQVQPSTPPPEKIDNGNKLSDTGSHASEENSSKKQKGKGTDIAENPSRPKVELIPEGETPENLKDRNPAKSLLEAYLYQQQPLHIRQSLDQHHFHKIADSTARDMDQVVARWHGSPAGSEDHNILVVDQLWIWVISPFQESGPDIVITSFPTEKAEQGLSKKIFSLEHEPRSSGDVVTHLIESVTEIYSETGDPVLADLVGIFGRAVDQMREEPRQLLRQFRQNLMKLHQPPETYADKRKRKTQNREQKRRLRVISPLAVANKVKEDGEEEDEMKLLRNKGKILDRLIDIRREMNSLLELDDICDEVPMLQSLFQDQMTALKQSKQVFSRSRFFYQAMDPSVGVGYRLGKFEEILKDAERITGEVNHVLELKQMQSSSWEAHLAREMVEANSKQGGLILVFTTITILFLPLSFMSSFFAIGVDKFPKDPETGDTNWPLKTVCGYIFGISLAVSVPFILITFNVYGVRPDDGWRRISIIAAIMWSILEASEALKKLTRYVFHIRDGRLYRVTVQVDAERAMTYRAPELQQLRRYEMMEQRLYEHKMNFDRERVREAELREMRLQHDQERERTRERMAQDMQITRVLDRPRRERQMVFTRS
ncbi:hypothetical protein DE146DRAFT_102053 [Phaeosphaeria sp. MPI-PUGE-AT-0046c]|nr:hypothetical protein DE146DRAFT_102053 [Phaeosphaeria sp. MPI-PUGE-AT-0046c]